MLIWFETILSCNGGGLGGGGCLVIIEFGDENFEKFQHNNWMMENFEQKHKQLESIIVCFITVHKKRAIQLILIYRRRQFSCSYKYQ